MRMAKKRTALNIDDDLLDRVRESGVRNFSKYVARLVEQDLRSLDGLSKSDAKKRAFLLDRLEAVREEWIRYAKKNEGMK